MSGGGDVRIWRHEDGKLRAALNGVERVVHVRRCFPWSEPGRYISLRDDDDREFAYVGSIDELTTESRTVLEQALAEAGFLLEITAVHEVREEVEIRSWSVATRQGHRRFQTRLDDWPLQIPGGGLLIRDVGGDLYHVPAPDRLDDESQGWLWAYAG